MVSTWSEAASLPSVVTGTVTSTDHTSPHDDLYTSTDHTSPHRAPLPPAADSHIQLSKVDVSPLLHLVGQGAPQQNLVEETVPQPSLRGQDPPQPRLAGHFAPQPLQYPPEGQSYLATIPVFQPPAITPPPPTVQGGSLATVGEYKVFLFCSNYIGLLMDVDIVTVASGSLYIKLRP